MVPYVLTEWAGCLAFCSPPVLADAAKTCTTRTRDRAAACSHGLADVDSPLCQNPGVGTDPIQCG